MTDINTVSLSGNLTKDGVAKMFTNGGVINFSLAVNRTVKKNDQWVDTPSYIECKYFTKGATKLAEYLKKGTPAVVDGSLEMESWEKDGQKFSRLVVNCKTVKWFTRQTQSSGNQQSYSAPQNKNSYQEDIPF